MTKNRMFMTGVLLPVILSILLPHLVSGQGYQIRFKVKGLKDTTCMIGNYYGNNTYVSDTLRVDKNGSFTYKAPPETGRGLYMVILSEKKYFEFVLNDDKKFSIETDISDLQGKISISGSQDNTLFYDYLKKTTEQYAAMQTIETRYANPKTHNDTLLVRQKIDSLNKGLVAYKNDLAAKYPNSFIALLINAMREPDVPEAPLLPNGRKDSLFQFRYYFNHYWDGTDFTDDRYLRTPVFYNKLKKYYDNVVVQTPDSVIAAVDRLIERSRPNEEMFKYMLWFATYHYESSEIMGFDKVFVHLVDKYYATGQATWVNKTVQESLIRKANRIRPLLIGSPAPNMVMMDTLGRLVSLYNLDFDYIIVLFWDPECGHCEKEIPKLKEFYDQNHNRLNLEVYAVCSDSSLVKMKKSIIKKGTTWINVNGPRRLTGNYHDEYDVATTPVIYILNRKKEIIAKQIRTDMIEQFFKNYKPKTSTTP